MKIINKILCFIIIGGVIGCLFFNCIKLDRQNKELSSKVKSLQTLDNDLSTNVENLSSEYTNYQNTTICNFSEQAIREQELILPLKNLDKKEYLIQYKNIISTYSDYIDSPETIYDYTTDEEFDLLCRVVEAEIGNGTFNQKCNVASTIINRYFDETFPNGWKNLLFQKCNGTYQYSSVGNGSYKTVTISDDTILAIEYSFMIKDTTNGCTYFHSGKSSWHENNLQFVFDDGLHKFYREKGEE